MHTAASQLVEMLVTSSMLVDSKAVEVALPLTGISAIALVPIGPTNVWVWEADGIRYVAQADQLRAMAAVFDAMADKLVDLDPTAQKLPGEGE